MIQNFLLRHGMAPEQVDVPLTCERFLGELAAGLAKAPYSILMLPTYLTHEGPLPRNLPVAVIDAGGTNARVAKVVMTAAGPVIGDLDIFPMPGSKGEIAKEEFFDTFAQKLFPFVKDCSTIGFCFSFPAQITPERDGKVLYFDKEVRVSGSEGMLLIQGLTATLRRMGVPNLRGVVLNDTVAALLGGLCQTDAAVWDGFSGLIWGTGINVCYAEPVENITGLTGSPRGTMLINTESGAFARVIQGDYDRDLDSNSKDPGRHLYEKMVSGAYLGEVIRRTLAGAAGEGLLNEGFAALAELPTWQADAFVVDPHGDNPLALLCQNDEERSAVGEIIDKLNLRAARLVGANLAAVLIRTGAGKDPARPACIVVEGSTFYKSKLLRPHLEAVMEEFVRGRLGRHWHFLKPENANLIGTAAAALLNRA